MATKIKATPFKTASFKVKPTIVDAVFIEELASPVLSTARVVISYVAVLCTGLGIGFVGGMLIEFLVLGALTLTGSLFISLVVYALGYIAMLYAAFIAGSWVGASVLNGSIDKCYQNVSSRVRGLFSFSSFSTSKEAS